MEDLVAPIDGIKFEIERFLDEQIGAQPLPFSGMDKSSSATCVFHVTAGCHRGSLCPFRHLKPDRTVVCKHWLRGLCKKGDSCEFLHEYDMSKMPECYFYSKFRDCSNKECPFLHIDPETKIKDCPWYDRGFCRHGPNCRNRHVRRIACTNYLCGFCSEGKNCKFVHLRFDLPSTTAPDVTTKKSSVICHYCNEIGHKIYNCTKIPPEQKEMYQKHNAEQPKYHNYSNENKIQTINNIANQHQQINGITNGDNNSPQQNKQFQYRPLDQVTCFKCGEKGHYANKCPKGYLAFLSPALKDLKRNNFNETDS